MTEPKISEHVRGINHLALVCSDMARTVDFYTNVLGFPLVKTVELPGGRGQHFFFDIGLPATLAFFWFPDAPPAAPGIGHQGKMTDPGGPVSAVASMNHVAFDVPVDQIEAMRDRLIAAGVECTPVVNHDDSPRGASREMHPGVFVRSVYFRDPDDISLELAAWTKVFDESDVQHAPAGAVPARA
jgi:catechol 2,3-dioxygenase-like lactoylglutathione lyase family enzyme